jgi:hypothetical protein
MNGLLEVPHFDCYREIYKNVNSTNAQNGILRDAQDTILRHFSREAEIALSNSH